MGLSPRTGCLGERKLPPGGFLETIKEMMPTVEAVFTDMSRRISAKDYSGDQASLEAYFVVTRIGSSQRESQLDPSLVGRSQKGTPKFEGS